MAKRSSPPPIVRFGIVDRAVAAFSPEVALRRLYARSAIDRMRGYEAASKGRGTAGWRANGNSADQEIALAGPVLRDRMRDLVRNNPMAAQAVQVLVNNIVGYGIRPRAATGDRELNQRIDALWRRWERDCDEHGHTNFQGILALAVRQMIEGGEVFAIARPTTRRRGGLVPLRIELREADHLDASRIDNGATGNRIEQGIEFDRKGRRVAYWMFPDHPGGPSTVFARRFESERIPAERVAHLFERQRVQSRGVPWGAPAMRHIRDLDDWQNAELVRKKTEACLVGIVFGAEDSEQGIAPAVEDADGNRIEQFEPGLIAYARNGKDIKFNQPSATSGIGEWLRAQQHLISSGFRVPYALMTGDMSQANFSSTRAGLNEFRRMIEQVQWQTVIPMFCERIWDWFVEYARIEGLLPIDGEFIAEWGTPRFESVNPLQDAQADLLEVRAGFSTIPQQIARRGYDPDEILEEAAEFNAKMDGHGLVFDADPRKVTKAGLVQTTDPNAAPAREAETE
ncbi:phage portal protein [Paracoccus jeotgali]|uniref:Phage portal protein n=1 Tax=Paracoccus jeotgali TaxID=2065379 RepID=A0A2K9MBG1_9RHOB|nr:phage portal protein [Paracoccus jeotgali]AUM72964.1 phage portal protein [Paracoccus jeotgali]